jgi:hypothetical protein
MSEGFMLEQTDGGYGGVSSWVEGKPEPSIWTGVKTGNRKMLQISTFRCSSCGFLESYAQG